MNDETQATKSSDTAYWHFILDAFTMNHISKADKRYSDTSTWLHEWWTISQNTPEQQLWSMRFTSPPDQWQSYQSCENCISPVPRTSENHAAVVKFVIHRSPAPVKIMPELWSLWFTGPLDQWKSCGNCEVCDSPVPWTSENHVAPVKPVIHRSPRPVKNVKESLALLTHQNSVNYENTIIMYVVWGHRVCSWLENNAKEWSINQSAMTQGLQSMNKNTDNDSFLITDAWLMELWGTNRLILMILLWSLMHE